MLLLDERIKVLEFCKKMDADNLTVGTSGNISIYNYDQDLLAISPSGMDYQKMTMEDVVVVDRFGKKVEGKCEPSSEIDLHRLLYLNREDVQAVVHTHSFYATTCAVLNKPIPFIHPNLTCAGEKVSCMPYMPSHTADFGKNVTTWLEDNYALLLGNHGVLTCGPSIEYAYNVAVVVEFVAALYCQCEAQGQQPIELSKNELEDMYNRFKQKRSKEKKR